MSRHPSTKWAQRPDKVYMTIELPDAKDVKLSLKPDGRFNFSAKAPADDMQYELDLELFDAVNVEESQAAVAPRSICYLVKKAEGKWWPRLLKKEGKPLVFLKVDWDKWQDEDDEDAGFGDFGDMDFSKLDMGGGDDDYDDDIEEDDEDNVVDSANKDPTATAGTTEYDKCVADQHLATKLPDAGVQEQEIPSAYFYVEIPDDQDQE